MGPACDQDKDFWNRVSAADKRRLGHKDKDDGIFFILWEDFLAEMGLASRVADDGALEIYEPRRTDHLRHTIGIYFLFDRDLLTTLLRITFCE